MQEQWTRWEPIKGLEGKYDIKKLSSDMNGLVVELYLEVKSSSRRIELIFMPFVDAYREVTEGFRLSLYHELSQNYEAGFYGNWTFFKVMNSKYVAWLIEDSSMSSKQIYSGVHYCLMGDDFIVDIVSRYEPVIKVIEMPAI